MKSTSHTRRPYSGTSRSLVIALDVGTTFSGVSYAILEPGEVPHIHGVTRFPGQEHVAGNSKIPSIMYYDKRGKMVVAGAEADGGSIIAEAEDEGWVKVELFKLRLRPTTMKLKMNGLRLASLPKGKTAVDVFGDFLAYLYKCTKTFFTDTHANGHAVWNAIEQNIQFVLSHPNGWEGAQQAKMRRAMIYGGIIPDTNEGKARIRFVTEGEASLHACVLNGLAADVLSNASNHGFLIADAGGGTLDLSSYAIRSTHPLVIEEIAPPDCIFAGSVFVSRRAREFLEVKLRNSKYSSPDALDHITKRFDETTKRLFRDKKDASFIQFGSPLDKDLSVGIRNGQLKLLGTEVAELFEPSIEAAVTAIKAQIDASGGLIKSVWLVGGFAASQWLFSQLQVRLAPLGITVSRPDSQTSKAVADGAIGFYCDHYVSARMSKYMYGVEYLREYNAEDPDHVARKSRLCELPSGPRLLPDAFDCILARGVKVKESTVFTRKYCTELTSLSLLSVFEVEIWCFRGGNETPKWIMREADDFGTLCVVRADLSPLASSAQPKAGKGGKTYWTIVFSVEIHFGLTEFKARIKWNDSGTIKYGPASIIFNESGQRPQEEEPDSSPEDELTIGSTVPSAAASRAPSRTGFNGPSVNGSASKRSSSYSTPKQEVFQDIPDVVRSDARPPSDRDRGFSDRDRSVAHSRHTSVSRPSVATDKANWRGDAVASSRVPSNPSSPMSERAASTNWRSDRSKGKERESYYPESDRGRAQEKRSEYSVNGDDRSIVGKIGDTLSSVWGAPAAGAPPSPTAPSVAASQRASRMNSIYGPPESASRTPTRSRHTSIVERTSIYDNRSPAKATPRSVAPEIGHSPLAASHLMPGGMPEAAPEPEPEPPVAPAPAEEPPQHLTPRARGLDLEGVPAPGFIPEADPTSFANAMASPAQARGPTPHLTPRAESVNLAEPIDAHIEDAYAPEPEPAIFDDVVPQSRSLSKTPSRATSRRASKVPTPHLTPEVPQAVIPPEPEPVVQPEPEPEPIPEPEPAPPAAPEPEPEPEQPAVSSGFGSSLGFGFGSGGGTGGGGGSSWGSGGGFGFGFGSKPASKAPSIAEPAATESSGLGSWGSSLGWGANKPKTPAATESSLGESAGWGTTKSKSKTTTPKTTESALGGITSGLGGWGLTAKSKASTPKAATPAPAPEPPLEEPKTDTWGSWGATSKPATRPASPQPPAKEPEPTTEAAAEDEWSSGFGWGSKPKSSKPASKAGSKVASKVNTPMVEPAPVPEPEPEPAPAPEPAPVAEPEVPPIDTTVTSPVDEPASSPVEFKTTGGKKKKKKKGGDAAEPVQTPQTPVPPPQPEPEPEPEPAPAAEAAAELWDNVVSPPSGSGDNLPQALFTDHLGISSAFDSIGSKLDDLGLGLSAPKTPAGGDTSDLLGSDPVVQPAASPKPSPKPSPKVEAATLPEPAAEVPAEPTVEAPPAAEEAPAAEAEAKAEDTDKDKLQVPGAGDEPATPVSPDDKPEAEEPEEAPAADKKGKGGAKAGGGGGAKKKKKKK